MKTWNDATIPYTVSNFEIIPLTFTWGTTYLTKSAAVLFNDFVTASFKTGSEYNTWTELIPNNHSSKENSFLPGASLPWKVLILGKF